MHDKQKVPPRLSLADGKTKLIFVHRQLRRFEHVCTYVRLLDFILSHNGWRITLTMLAQAFGVYWYHPATDGCGRTTGCLDRLFDRLRVKNFGRLRYHVRETKDPKGVLKLSELNVAFAPAKIGHMNSMQLTFMKDGSTRHIYVYHEEPEVINNWYTAIRCAQLHLLQVAFPSTPQSDLVLRLPKDFAREGWLWKTGPRPSDAHRRRWFTLDNRKLMYHDEPLDAYPKGEIFIGHESNGYSIKVSNTGNGCKEARFPFQLVTPERTFCFAATTHEERDGWITVLHHVVQRPLTPQDSTVEATLVRKRTASNSISIFSGR